MRCIGKRFWEAGLMISTNPAEFKRFHEALTKDQPEYQPFYFPLEKNGKDPLKGNSWKARKLTFSKAVSLMQDGYNIGIAATNNDRLCIVDVDDMERVGEIKPTLKIRSRKRIGEHNFYFTNDNGSGRSAKSNIATDDAGEVRSSWQYVVCAGSFVPCSEEEIIRIPEADRANAGKYSILQEREVSEITFDELPEVYKNEVFRKEAEAAEKHARELTGKANKGNEKREGSNKSALYSLDIYDVTGKHDDPGERFPMFSEIHGSETGGNASVAKGLLTCWRHGVCHNALTYLAVASGLSTCNSAGFGHGDGSSSVDFEDPSTIYTIWKYAKDNGHLPKDDPIPALAMKHLALENKFCEKKDITEGWKLPTKAYNSVIEWCNVNKIESGREKIESVRGRPKKDKAAEPEKIRVPFDVVADRILKQFDIFNMRDTGQIYIYNNGVYKNDGADAIIETHIRRVHDEVYNEYWGIINPTFELTHIQKATTTYVNEVLAYIRSLTHIPRKEIDEAANRYINLKNGLFNLSEWKFEAHDPKYLSISQSPINYDENATCPKISQFLTDVARPEDIDFLFEWMGYCLTLEVQHQKAVLLYGPPGTGKSVYLSLLEAAVGEESRTCQPLQKIESEKYRRAQLYGKKVSICSDIPDTKMHQSYIFKALTSGLDTIDGENKFKDPFSFKNTAKLTFSANKIPEGPKDEAYYQRWILIEFANRFRGTTKEVKGIIQSLTTAQELSGLLNLALNGLKQVKDTGVFSYSKTFAEIEKEYLLNSNPSAAFMDECIVMSTEDLDSTILYATFVEWCQTHNTELVSKIGFSRKISEMGFTSHRENVTRDGSKKVTVWDNISLRKQPVGQDDEEIGQDTKKSSCPKISSQPTMVNLPEIVFGQDEFSYVANKNEKKQSVSENIETVEGVESINFNTSADMSKSSCPRGRLFDSVRYGQDDKKYPVRILSETQNPLSLNQNVESDSEENLTTSELLRRDLKNYARSEYNSVVENVPVFVGDFNKKYPGFVNSLGLQAILSNAERLKEMGWR